MNMVALINQIHDSRSNMFPCECDKAVCCRSVGHIPELISVNGVCDQLDTQTNRCKIYDARPLICRVDDYYLEHLTSEMSLDEWYEQNMNACKELNERDL